MIDVVLYFEFEQERSIVITRKLVWQEFYADYFAIDPFHFTLNLPSNHLSMLPTVADPHNSQLACDRMLDGIAAIFLSLKKRPVIRYERSSEISKRVAQDAAVGFSCLFILLAIK